MPNSNNYIPKPVDTSKVKLPKDLEELAETMAHNTHEVWAANRMKEGWTYGEKRDDAKKENPCMIPYDQLPENEKDYDRSTSLETIKLILSLGYKIKKESSDK